MLDRCHCSFNSSRYDLRAADVERCATIHAEQGVEMGVLAEVKLGKLENENDPMFYRHTVVGC